MIPPTQVHMIPLKDLLISRQRLLALSQSQKRLRPPAKFRNIRRLRIQADHDFPITLLLTLNAPPMMGTYIEDEFVLCTVRLRTIHDSVS